MPCPYFIPSAPASWLGSYPRLPLGEAWEGECAAGPDAFHPQGATLFEICNTGQGRLRCPRFPAGAPTDAVRFHVKEDTAERLSILWVLERECWPAENGMLTFLVGMNLLDPAPQDSRLAAQATAFARTYVNRRG